MHKRKNKLRTMLAVVLIAMMLQGCGTGANPSESGTGSGPAATAPSTAIPDASLQPGTAGTDSPEGNGTGQADGSSNTQNDAAQNNTAQQQKLLSPEELKTVKPNESGRIMVVMFHNFVEEYKKGDKAYTTTFDAFSRLLDTLYTSGYRLISLKDYLGGEINVPAGCIPMVFTFDDGTAGQFNLLDQNGALAANPRSAVGILEEFNKSHPDFGMKGTFFVNLGDNTFNGEGTLAQRLEYLTGKGFELGNHTYTHINLKETKSADKIQEEIGGNQKKMYELIPGYAFTAFSLPYGAPSKELEQYVIKGEYEGVFYENQAIMEVGWDPAPSPFSVKFNPLSTHRVRASGIAPVQSDLAWWLENLKRDKQYISDGNSSVITVPEASAEFVDQSRLNSRTLVKY